MKATEFCYWLQGYFELVDPTSINATQTDLIKRHLNMVFIHDIDKTYPEGEQEALNAAHDGKSDINNTTTTSKPAIFGGGGRC